MPAILQDPEVLVGLVSLIVVVVLAYAGFVANQKRERRSHTLNVLIQFSTSETLGKADRAAAQILEAGTLLPSELPDDQEATLMQLLDHYELVATAYNTGILDRPTVRHVRGGAMRRAFRLCEPYIRAHRDRLQRPELYLNLEKATRHMAKGKT